VQESWLSDWGVGPDVEPIAQPVAYPFAVPRFVRNLSVNINEFGPIAENASLTIELFRDGVLVPGFTVVFLTASPLIQTAIAGPELFDIGQVLALKVQSQNLQGSVQITATIGLE
jgi:hypothetical protein